MLQNNLSTDERADTASTTPQTREQHPTPKQPPSSNVKSRKRIRSEESFCTDKAGMELRKRIKPSDPERDPMHSIFSSNQDVSADMGKLSGAISITTLGMGERDQQGKTPIDHQTEGTITVSKRIVRKHTPAIASPAARPSGSSVSVDNATATSLEGLTPMPFVPIDPELLAEQEVRFFPSRIRVKAHYSFMRQVVSSCATNPQRSVRRVARQSERLASSQGKRTISSGCRTRRSC